MLVKTWQDIERPQHSRKGVEKTLFGKRLAATLSTSPTERIHVWIGEVAWMPVDSPHVTSKVGASWKVVALVIEIDGISMRNAS
jgi:hypothetical protein